MIHFYDCFQTSIILSLTFLQNFQISLLMELYVSKAVTEIILKCFIKMFYILTVGFTFIIKLYIHIYNRDIIRSTFVQLLDLSVLHSLLKLLFGVMKRGERSRHAHTYTHTHNTRTHTTQRSRTPTHQIYIYFLNIRSHKRYI